MNTFLTLSRFSLLAISLCTCGPVAAQNNLVDITNAGGFVTAQYYDSPGGEEITNIFDNRDDTKYFTFNKTACVQLQQEETSVVSKYTLTATHESPSVHPATWALLASNDGIAW